MANTGNQLFRVFRLSTVGAYGKAVFAQKLQHTRLGMIWRVLNGTYLIEKGVQSARSRYRGVKITQGTGRSVACILQRFLCSFIILLQHA